MYLTMDLVQFIRESERRTLPYNNNRAWLDQPGFSAIYVRWGTRWIKNTKTHPVLDIASVEAAEPGNGAFKSLIKFIRETYPHVTIFVENVLPEKFRGGLLRLGFEVVETSHPMSPCFVLTARSDGTRTGSMQIGTTEPNTGQQ